MRKESLAMKFPAHLMSGKKSNRYLSRVDRKTRLLYRAIRKSGSSFELGPRITIALAAAKRLP